MIRVKNRITWGITIALLLLVLAALATVVQGGPLDPPAAPTGLGPTMITALPFTADASAPGGSYLLAKDLTCSTCTAGQNGITITANNVSIDLGGFAITGVAGSGNGIQSGALVNISVANGTVRNWDAGDINLAAATDSTVERVRVYSGGNFGISIGTGGRISRSQVSNGTGDGILANSARETVEDNTVEGNTGNGIVVGTDSNVVGNTVVNNGASGGKAGITSTASDVRVANNMVGFQANGGDGILLTGGHVSVTGNQVDENTGNGIHLSGAVNGNISDNSASNNTRHGILQAGDGATISRNTLSGNFGNGILVDVTGKANRIDENHIDSSAGVGLGVGGSANLIMRNTSQRNTGCNYFISAGNQQTGEGTLTTRTNPWDNMSESAGC